MLDLDTRVMEQQDKYIIVTGAAGFIGSALVAFLNHQGYTNLVLVDDFSRIDKAPNLIDKSYAYKVHRSQLEEWMEQHGALVSVIFHLGAKTDTTLQDKKIFKELNLDYSKMLWEYATQYQIPFIYASSAATYGNGSLGYQDNEANIPLLQPLNPYGISKQKFDVWALEQKEQPPHWYGLKFFNVYGPNEYHKGRMASVIFHAYQQIKKDGVVKLFKSHKPEYEDGGQLRDFVYVVDVVKVCFWLFQNLPTNGIYNLGTGKARSFKDLVLALFSAIDQEANIQYIDTPEDIREAYQYYTQADMGKLRGVGYADEFFELEDGVADYVSKYLIANKNW